MAWLYTIGIVLFSFAIRLASLFNKKAKLFIEGRKNIFQQIQSTVIPASRPVWFHFASLGEFEQGRPVLEAFKAKYANEKIIITFFSPSGYEVRKNYTGADGVFYLPLDTAANARRFIELANPKMAIFTKYEFWYHYFNALHQRQVPLYLISAIFRPGQVFFKWYGGFNRRILRLVSHFFVQNEESMQLLHNIGFKNVTRSGDTRFDRVYTHTQHPQQLPLITTFCGEAPVVIAGSTWPDDEKLLADLALANPGWKFILAPHEIHQSHIREIEGLFPDSVRFSEYALNAQPATHNIQHTAHNIQHTTRNPQTLIIDNIGMLSSLYAYGKIAYIGGGFGAGIHNTLEAAAFGLPVIFGPKYDKFQEAKDLIALGAAQSIKNASELDNAFEQFKWDKQAGVHAKTYVADNKGATAQILSRIERI